VDESAQRLSDTIEVVFTFVRRLTVFGLGCWVIGNALVNPEERATQLIIGMVMVGVLPIENFFRWRRGTAAEDDRAPPN
jgi:hypothetical protein